MYDKTDLAHLRVLEKFTLAAMESPGATTLFKAQLRRIKAEIFRVSKKAKR